MHSHSSREKQLSKKHACVRASYFRNSKTTFETQRQPTIHHHAMKRLSRTCKSRITSLTRLSHTFLSKDNFLTRERIHERHEGMKLCIVLVDKTRPLPASSFFSSSAAVTETIILLTTSFVLMEGHHFLWYWVCVTLFHGHSSVLRKTLVYLATSVTRSHMLVVWLLHFFAWA